MLLVGRSDVVYAPLIRLNPQQFRLSPELGLQPLIPRPILSWKLSLSVRSNGADDVYPSSLSLILLGNLVGVGVVKLVAGQNNHHTLGGAKALLRVTG